MSRRTDKAAEAVREAVAEAVLFELKDPRVVGVTVLRAEVAGDFRNARVFVSIMGDEKAAKLTLRGLQSARGFLQKKVAERLATRYTPMLEIVVDQSVKTSLEVSRLLDDVLPRPAPEQPESDVEEAGDAQTAAGCSEGSHDGPAVAHQEN